MATNSTQITHSFTRVLFLLALVTLFPALTWAQNLYGAQDKTLFAAGEAALTAQTELTQELGGSGNLAVNGTFSSTGWTLSLQGTQGGVPVSLQYVGSYDPTTNSSTFLSSGTVGGNPWNGDGSALFTDTNNSQFNVAINAEAAFLVGNQQVWPDSHTVFKWKRFWQKGGYRYGLDFGVWYYTKKHQRVGKLHYEKSSAKAPLDPSLDGMQVVCITNESCVSTTFNVAAGTFWGNATTNH